MSSREVLSGKVGHKHIFPSTSCTNQVAFHRFPVLCKSNSHRFFECPRKKGTDNKQSDRQGERTKTTSWKGERGTTDMIDVQLIMSKMVFLMDYQKDPAVLARERLERVYIDTSASTGVILMTKETARKHLSEVEQLDEPVSYASPSEAILCQYHIG